MKALITFAIIFSFHLCLGQEELEENLLGGWTIEYQIGERDDEKCSCSDTLKPAIVLEEKGRYYKESNMIVNGELIYPIRGDWKMKKRKKLTLDDDDYGNGRRLPQTERITWVNEDCFFMQGREGPRGPKVYTYYRRVKVQGSIEFGMIKHKQ